MDHGARGPLAVSHVKEGSNIVVANAMTQCQTWMVCLVLDLAVEHKTATWTSVQVIYILAVTTPFHSYHNMRQYM